MSKDFLLNFELFINNEILFYFFSTFSFCSSFFSMSMEVMFPYIICEKINFFVFKF